MIDAQELIDAIEGAGYDARDYSGRAMYGSVCVGVDLDGDGDLWKLAGDLAQQGHEVPAPRTDSMGRGIIAYWPSIKWPQSDASAA